MYEKHLSEDDIDLFVISAAFIKLVPATRKYWMINYKQHWFDNSWPQRNEPVIIDIFKWEFRLTPSTFEFS